jgi:2-aminomuconate deaminase
MSSDSSFHATEAPRPVGPYPHARRAGNLLFLSGIGPRSPGDDSIPGTILDEAGTVVGYDFEAQCHAVFENVRRVLAAAGATFEDLVDVTVFLTDIASDFEAMNRIYAHYLHQNPPSRTTVEVRRLPTPIAIELKCIATIHP